MLAQRVRFCIVKQQLLAQRCCAWRKISVVVLAVDGFVVNTLFRHWKMFALQSVGRR